jgi:hypothetical protein
VKQNEMILMHNKLFFITVFLLMVALVLSCSKLVSNNDEHVQHDEKLISAMGTVTFIEIEGGFFGIIADNGDKYRPLNLPKDFQKDGVRVRFEGKINSDIMGVYMWGEAIEIKNIKGL